MRGRELRSGFSTGVAAAALIGLAVRLLYVFGDSGRKLGGDGLDYHLDGLRLADGLGYTGSLFYPNQPDAQHPPGWTTVLGAVSAVGGRSQLTHQLVGVAIGVALVVVAGLVGRRYFNTRVGVLAALLAALYPGFWLLESSILSEPLTVLVLGVCMLAVRRLRERPTLAGAAVMGALCGLAALTRSEELAFLFFVVVPVLLARRSLTWSRRVGLTLLAIATAVLVISPWSIYNATRFNQPVVLSVNGWSTALAGNCPPITYEGRRLGTTTGVCIQDADRAHPDLDPSERDPVYARQTLKNVRGNLDRLPIVVPARIGRSLGLFRPGQTLARQALFLGTGTGPVWAWVISFLVLVPLAVVGGVAARRERRFILPLVVPIALSLVLIASILGEPRWHSPGDLGVVVLAAAGVDRLMRTRRTSPAAGAQDPAADEVTDRQLAKSSGLTRSMNSRNCSTTSSCSSSASSSGA